MANKAISEFIYLNFGSAVVTTPISNSEGLKSIESTVDKQVIAVCLWRRIRE